MRARSGAPSWSATPLAGRVLLVVAGVLTVLGAGAVSVALRTPPAHLRREVTAVAPRTVALDAAGCPATARCAVRAELPPGLLAAVYLHFDGSSLLWLSSTVDPSTGTVHRAQAALSPGPGATLLVTADCVPGSTAHDPERSASSAQQRSDLAGNQLALLTARRLQVPGSPGCQLTVQLTAPGDGSRYAAQLAALAHDPSAQLPP